jgi:rhamnosyltransferase
MPHGMSPTPALARPNELNPIPAPANVCAVVVTYHPGQELPVRLATLAEQVEHIIIIDNASDPAERDMMRRLADGRRIELIENQNNLGVAAALNIGAARASQRGQCWLLTMDQDTAVHPDLLSGMSEAYRACPFRDRVAVIAANFMVANYGDLFVRAGRDGPPFVERATAITSGSLVSLPDLEAAGGFREDFFIDFVDHEYCLRLRSMGRKIIYTSRPLMDHAIGQPRRYRLLWFRPASSNHSPLRRYYMTRNRLVTAWTYAVREPKAVAADLYRILGEAVLVTLFEDRKWPKLRAIFLGACHAVMGRMGQLPSSLNSN